jgi:hypothetical protein
MPINLMERLDTENNNSNANRRNYRNEVQMPTPLCSMLGPIGLTSEYFDLDKDQVRRSDFNSSWKKLRSIRMSPLDNALERKSNFRTGPFFGFQFSLFCQYEASLLCEVGLIA